LGDDTFVIDSGTGTNIISGSAGTDTLSITYAGISSVSDFAVSVDGDYKVLTDANNNVIKFKNIETIQIAGISYIDIYDGRTSSSQWTINTGVGYTDPSSDYQKTYVFTSDFNWHNNIISSAFYSSTEDLVALYSFAEGKGSNFTIPSLQYLLRDENGQIDNSYLTKDYTILGTAYNDGVSDRDGMDCVSGDFNISTYAGDDVISMSGYCLGAQTLDAGSGDDKVFVNYNFITKDNVSAKGGAGEDWLIINSWNNQITYTLNTSNTSGFENIKSGNAVDVITGDTNNNIIYAYGGADTVYGLAGDDVLYGASPVNNGLGQDSDDILYGGDGNDTLIGGPGNNTLDGGPGKDILSGKTGISSGDNWSGTINDNNTYHGEYGINTFIIRAGDGGSSIDGADVITDFEDNNDLIGMADGLEYSQLTIEQGTGDYANHVVVKKTDTGEFLVIIQNILLENVTYFDVVSQSSDVLNLTGTSGDDILLGASGNDSISSGTGNDTILGYGGDDTITINGAGNKIIYGGAGTDTLSITYAGISSVSDFAVSVDGDYKVLTDANNNVIKFKNIETIQIAGISYIDIYDGRTSSSQWTINTGVGYTDPSSDYQKTYVFTSDFNWHNNIISSAFYSSTEDLVALYSFAEGKGSNFTIPSLQYLLRDENGQIDNSYLTKDYTILGTAYNDGVSDRDGMDCVSGDFNISTYAGDDVISMSGYCLGAQTLDAGSGDDKVFVNYNFITKDNVSAKGGAGEDWLIINSWNNQITYTLNTSNTSGFENIKSGNAVDVITGDTNNNIIYAYGGADTVYGLAGDDVLYGASPVNNGLGQDSDDILYGGDGNDTLIGGPGNNTLDGGPGKDILSGKTGISSGDNWSGTINDNNTYHGEYGINTFIIRAGDGGSSIDGEKILAFILLSPVVVEAVVEAHLLQQLQLQQ